jgi:hypothetical protein
MSAEIINNIVKEEKKHLKKYKQYIQTNNWTFLVWNQKGKPKLDTDIRKEEFNLHNNIINTILTRLKVAAKKSEGSHHLKSFKDYVGEIKKLLELHKQRAEEYMLSSDVLEKSKDDESSELRSNEIDFHRHLHQTTAKVLEDFNSMNLKLDDERAADGIEFYDSVKAPLSMHNVLVELYPQIQRTLDEMGIDFTSPPKNEMLINIPNPPKWNTDKHYFHQEKETLQFYVDEFKKIKNGINIDGIYISGWAYYHINVFVTPIPHKVWNPLKNDYDSEDKIINPPLRDSDWMLFENRALQESTKTLFMFVAATRRAAKTTAEASMLGHAATVGKKELLCAGSNAKDLGQLAKNFKTDTLYKNPAFAIYNVANDWSKKIEIGIKTKTQKTIPLSTLHIINTDDGNNKEIFAGFTPDLVVIDEAMKSKFLEALEGLIPAMQGSDGMIRAFGMLSGTGGTEKLSEDGYKSLSDPATYDILPMQWQILERGVDEKFITWREDKKRPFGTFIPGQCRVDMPKIKGNLADYLGVDSPTLRKISINITDWEKSAEIIKEKRKKVEKDRLKHQKEVVYCPTKPSEIFMSGALNPFPVEELKRRREELLEKGDIGKKVTLIQDNTGKISYELSNKELAGYPHPGGFIDAPIVLYEELPEVTPPTHLYVAGFDDYKQDESDTDSVGSFHIYKVNIGMDEWCGRIVASLATRPDPHGKLHRQIFLLQQAFNAKCFMENADDKYKQYLETKRVADLWLYESIDFKGDITQKATNKRRYGWTPTPQNIRFLKNLVINYTKEEFTILNEDGDEITVLGAQRINDLTLIQEMIDYRESANVDRMTSFMSCLGIEYYLYTNWLLPKPDWEKQRKSQEKPKPKTEKNLAQRMYGGSVGNRRIF